MFRVLVSGLRVRLYDVLEIGDVVGWPLAWLTGSLTNRLTACPGWGRGWREGVEARNFAEGLASRL